MFEALRAAHRADETDAIRTLIDDASFPPEARRAIRTHSEAIITQLRARRREVGGIDALVHAYDLSSSEGVTLMCLAEALLRIPDAATQNVLIEDKLADADFASHLGSSEHLFVNASTFGLMVAGRTVTVDDDGNQLIERLMKRLGTPAVRLALRRAMGILGNQFVFGESIAEAMEHAAEQPSYQHSFDMLGEAAFTQADADRYLARYQDALRALAGSTAASPQISVKLSAIHPRFEFAQRDRVHAELAPRLMTLCQQAAEHGIGVCVDAEEADRLELTLELVEAMATDARLSGWQGLGLAVQAYQKRAPAVIDWLADLATRSMVRLNPRLVKGAYWDTEIKRAQELGLAGFPVYTVKAHTDISYLACARRLLAIGPAITPCFATHNANTFAAIAHLVDDLSRVEFQRLHGMGEALYDHVITESKGQLQCRVYAPVGEQRDLLAYLVRRLLENGANTSFVNRIADDRLGLADIVRDPLERAAADDFAPHPGIAAPRALFGPDRPNSHGLDLESPLTIDALEAAGHIASRRRRRAGPMVNGTANNSTASGRDITAPQDHRRIIGTVTEASAEDATEALREAAAAHPAWSRRATSERADLLRRAADRLESSGADFMWLLSHEAGKTIEDAHLEVRETVDFLRYYAAEAERLAGAPVALPGPTGETNTLSLHGRGPFLCIAPWNFPLAIFTGQIAAALAAGCTVLAKPAEQTCLIAGAAVELLHAAGVPPNVLHLLPGDGATIADAVLADDRLAGVCFTGSTSTAQIINRNLAARTGPIIPLIAETGGINAMIVDSTALAEQVTRDVVTSAFQSAGQRCSALRLLCLQEDIYERQLEMIAGAMAELRIGDPWDIATDVGPVIDDAAQAGLERYRQHAAEAFEVLAATPLHPEAAAGTFVRPTLIAIDRVADLQEEIFGPILHVVRFPASGIDQLVDDINALGFGLTLSVHSRANARIEQVTARARVGNVYINRNQIGAVVGSQPFGGEGLSGTGPKAGGPHYLPRFLLERTRTENTTAAGGNTSIMTLP